MSIAYQIHYIHSILDKHNMLGRKPAATLADPSQNVKLTPRLYASRKEKLKTDVVPHRHAIRQLRYLLSTTPPDVSKAAGFLYRHVSDTLAVH